MLRWRNEGVGVLEPVPICHQLLFFLRGQLKHEFGGESFTVSLDLRVQPVNSHHTCACLACRALRAQQQAFHRRNVCL